MCQELLSWHPRQSQSRVALLQRALWEPCALDGEGRAIGSTELPGFARRLAAGARSEVLRSAPPFSRNRILDKKWVLGRGCLTEPARIAAIRNGRSSGNTATAHAASP